MIIDVKKTSYLQDIINKNIYEQFFIGTCKNYIKKLCIRTHALGLTQHHALRTQRSRLKWVLQRNCVSDQRGSSEENTVCANRDAEDHRQTNKHIPALVLKKPLNKFVGANILSLFIPLKYYLYYYILSKDVIFIKSCCLRRYKHILSTCSPLTLINLQLTCGRESICQSFTIRKEKITHCK